MPEDVYRKMISVLSDGAMGLKHVYFNQGEANADHINNSVKILGNFGQGNGNQFSGGICFGLAMLYLGCNSPGGRKQWTTQQAVIRELKSGVNGAGNAPGLLKAIAEAYVRQEKARVIEKSLVTTDADQSSAETAYDNVTKAYNTELKKYMQSNAVDEDTAIRDKLLMNFSLKPDAKGKNYFPCELELDYSFKKYGYGPKFTKSSVDGLLDVAMKRNSYCLIDYQIPFVGGHQMASVNTGGTTYFFDPNYGVVSTTFRSGLRTFLAHTIPFLYLFKGINNKKSSTEYVASDPLGSNYYKQLSMTMNVYRYKA